MDLNRLNRGLQIAGASAVALLAFMFFPWYGRTAAALEGREFGINVTAWQAFSVIDIVLLALAAFVIAAALFEAGGREPRLPIPPSILVTVAGIAAVALIAYRLIDPPVDLERRYGTYLALIAAIGIVVGGRISMGERRETFAQARETVSEQVAETRRQAAETLGGHGSSRRYEDRSKEELYEEASRHNIEGRSEMSKEELAEALRRAD